MHVPARDRLVLALSLIFAAGCGDPPLFQATTIVRPDGSCERTIVQPRLGYLPNVGTALRVRRPTATCFPTNGRRNGRRSLGQSVHRRGPPTTRRSSPIRISTLGYVHLPQRHPAALLVCEQAAPQRGRQHTCAEIERTDFGLFVEYRWKETLTNSVTRERFIAGIDVALDIVERTLEGGLPKALAKRMTSSRL